MTSGGLGDERPASLQPTPAHAEVAFAGEVFEVLRWKQELFDGSTKVFEKVRRRDTALVLPVVDGLLRIAVQEQPGFTEPFAGLIGGRVEPGESVEEAARRELLEEANLIPGSLELWVTLQPFVKIDWTIFIFVARGCRGANSSTEDPGERTRLVDVSLDELVAMALQESFRDVGVALHLLRMAADPMDLAKARDFLGVVP